MSDDIPGREPHNPAPAPHHRDGWDKAQIILQPVGGLFTAVAITLLGFFSSQFLERRQAAESNSRLYSELMSRREEAESALRKDMFQTIIGAFVTPGSHGADLNSELLNLELLAYNFHESLNLKPLFIDVRRRIMAGETHATTAEMKAEYAGYSDRIERVAREIARKQMIVLEGVGQKFDRSVDLTGDPAGTTLEPATLKLGSRQSTFTIDILDVDRENEEILIGLSVDTPDSAQGRQTKTATFNVGYFDFPMIDNTRLTGGDRCAVVLNSMSPESADLTLVLFPGAYASLKEKPYYSEVIESIRQANIGTK